MRTMMAVLAMAMMLSFGSYGQHRGGGFSGRGGGSGGGGRGYVGGGRSYVSVGVGRGYGGYSGYRGGYNYGRSRYSYGPYYGLGFGYYSPYFYSPYYYSSYPACDPYYGNCSSSYSSYDPYYAAPVERRTTYVPPAPQSAPVVINNNYYGNGTWQRFGDGR